MNDGLSRTSDMGKVPADYDWEKETMKNGYEPVITQGRKITDNCQVANQF